MGTCGDELHADVCIVLPYKSWSWLYRNRKLLFPPPAAGNNVEVDESLFQDIDDLDLDEDDPDFDPLEMGSDED